MISKRWFISFICLIIILSAIPAHAQSESPAQPTLNAKGAILIEASTGKVLFEQDADISIAPASFTKIMTLYLTFEAIKQGLVRLEDEIWVSKRAWQTGGSKMFIEVNEQVPLEELIKGIAVVSGNDACVAVAEHLYGSVDAFVTAMNRKASELGLAGTHFANPHGLPDEEQVTTPRDMAVLCRDYLQRFPEALKYHSMQEYTFNEITQPNRNRLLVKDNTVDGLKTGYVADAGYHLTATALRDGMRLIAVVMGAESPRVREREALKLLNYGYRHYARATPFDSQTAAARVKIWKASIEELDLFPEHTVNMIVPHAKKDSIHWEITTEPRVVAPVAAGQKLGEITIYLGDDLVEKVPLVSNVEVPPGPWYKRLWHGLLMFGPAYWKVAGAAVAGLFILLVIVSFFRRRGSARRGSSPLGGKTRTKW